MLFSPYAVFSSTVGTVIGKKENSAEKRALGQSTRRHHEMVPEAVSVKAASLRFHHQRNCSHPHDREHRKLSQQRFCRKTVLPD